MRDIHKYSILKYMMEGKPTCTGRKDDLGNLFLLFGTYSGFKFRTVVPSRKKEGFRNIIRCKHISEYLIGLM